MATSVIIGNNTQVSFGGACVISVNWGMDPGRQDAYCLGSWEPNDLYTIYKPQRTLNITLYAPGPTNSIAATTGCDTTGYMSASVSPQACGGATGGDISGATWLVASYSYSKTAGDQPGQESWSLVDYEGATNLVSGNVATPSFISRGTPTGQSTASEDVTGIDFKSTFAEGSSGSVSAGSTGTASTTTYGIVQAVGGGSSAAGVYGEGSASIPLTPIYI